MSNDEKISQLNKTVYGDNGDGLAYQVVEIRTTLNNLKKNIDRFGWVITIAACFGSKGLELLMILFGKGG